MKILVTGATGYIGGRLIPELLKKGHEVRVLVRDTARIQGRPWTDQVKVFQGDLLSMDDLSKAFEGVEVAYYLIHSMRAGSRFEERDREAAHNFVAAARKVALVIYLGGLVPRAKRASRHLQSRAEVGRILRENLPTTEFRAGPIIGSGSVSFEMIRYLTERLPIMTAPRWILNRIQPLAVRDVLQYLVTALEKPSLGIVEVGCDPLTFKDMMAEYASVRRLRRLIIPMPVLAPRLAGLWVSLVTPIPKSMALPLVAGILHPLLADTEKARQIFPQITPISYRRAVELALEKTLSGSVETRWSGALGTAYPTYDLVDEEGQIREVRSLLVAASPAKVYHEFASLGGETGWLFWDWAWRVRGFFDRLIGGPGLRRGRRNSEELLPGEALDFWRVEVANPPHLLRLRAEMKLPGKAWIQWEAFPASSGTKLVQTSIFSPKGLGGALYGHALYPAHRIIFSGMINALAARATAA